MTASQRVCIALAFVLTGAANASLVSEYNFDGSLASSTGGPPLTDIGPGNTFSTEVVDGATTGILVFPQKSGLLYSPSARLEGFAISAFFRFDSVSGYAKVMSFLGDGDECGLYTSSGLVEYYCNASAAGQFKAATWHELTISREAASKVVKLWIDGTEVSSFTDQSGAVVIDPVKAVRFFVDDSASGFNESSSGAVNRIRIYDTPIVPDIRTPEPPPPPPCPTPVTARIPASEREALLALFASTNGANWARNTHWGCDAGTECSWFGVQCNGDQTSIDTIYLGANGLDGPLPDKIGDLANIRAISFVVNRLSGPLPERIGDLTELTSLDLGANKLSGPIPPAISKLTRLDFLGLNNNQFSGTVPPLGSFKALRVLFIGANRLTGQIPSSMCELENLENINASDMQLEGSIPDCIGNLSKLRAVNFVYNQLTGPIPQSISSLAELDSLVLWGNQLSGPIPAGITNLEKLTLIQLAYNRLSGPIPASIGSMPVLEDLWLDGNELSGTIPSSIVNASKLEKIRLASNQFSGPIPSGLSGLTQLDELLLGGNQLSGTIPSEIGSLAKLRTLTLDSNLLEGGIPQELGQLVELDRLDASRNNLRGEVPASFSNLTKATIDLGDNALRASAPGLQSFLEARGKFLDLQTIPPSDVQIDAIDSYTATLTWTPISYSFQPGGYQVLASTTPGGPYTPLVTTSDKSVPAALVTGLQPSTKYYFTIQTVTYPFGGRPSYQLNTVFSDLSAEVSGTTSPPSPTPPNVILTAAPKGIVQTSDVGGATDGYTLTNIGGQATTITLTQTGTFFLQSPALFTLEPGASQTIVLTGVGTASGEYTGESRPTGLGVAPGLTIQVRLISSAASASATITAEKNRIDLIAPASENPTGQIVFRNAGPGAFAGVASSDVQFLTPMQGLITIPAGGSVAVTVTSDRTKRPDASLLKGSQVGRISLVAIAGFGGSSRTPLDGAASVSLVTVVDTVKPPSAEASIPPLVPGELALFLSSVGHVVGSVGEFLSDLSIVNIDTTSPAIDVKLFYTALGGTSPTKTSSLPALGTSQAIGLADVVKSVFDGTSEVGTLQIRSTKTRNLSVSANIFAISSPRGNFGTAIPVLRSDRAIVEGGEIFLTGLRKDDSSHTNFFIQEVRGAPASVRLDLLDAAGLVVGVRPVSIGSFALAAISSPPELVPGTVAARIVNLGGGGAIAAYATPVDRASSDTWAVSDWALQYGYDPTETVVIPIAGRVAGANNTFFKTDVSISNRCSTSAVNADADPDTIARAVCRDATSRGTLRYYPVGGGVMSTTVELGFLQTAVLDDVVKTKFGFESGALGHLLFVPERGSFAVTSRTYNTEAGSPGTYGSTVPALGTSLAIRPGQSRRFGGLPDSTTATIVAKTPATNRTNFGIVETSGAPATVRMTVFYDDPRSLASGAPLGSVTYELAPRQLLNLQNLVKSVVGPDRDTRYRDLSGVQVRFEVIGGTGTVLVYTSSVDNGTGDSIFRNE